MPWSSTCAALSIDTFGIRSISFGWTEAQPTRGRAGRHEAFAPSFFDNAPGGRRRAPPVTPPGLPPGHTPGNRFVQLTVTVTLKTLSSPTALTPAMYYSPAFV